MLLPADDDGASIQAAGTLHYALGGALLAELALLGRVEVDDTGTVNGPRVTPPARARCPTRSCNPPIPPPDAMEVIVMAQLEGMVPATSARGSVDTAAASGPVISVDSLNVTYGDFHAVKDLSFEVARGELYALLGTNGAGKTSTLEVIEGHREATSGEVRVFGKKPTDRRAVQSRMGIMLQESGFSPDLTVAESVGLFGRLSGRADTVERVLGVIDLAGKSDTLVSQLSGGEKRRLDFATAVYGGPALIVLDEPTTGLDIQSRDAVWDAVERLREDGSTIVLTTHYLEEAQQRADRIGLMHRGTFRRQGTVAELTRTLPAVIEFSLPSGAPAPARLFPAADGTYRIETSQLQRDLKQLLDWADAHEVELRELSAAPTRLDDVFRAIDADS